MQKIFFCPKKSNSNYFLAFDVSVYSTQTSFDIPNVFLSDRQHGYINPYIDHTSNIMFLQEETR